MDKKTASSPYSVDSSKNVYLEYAFETVPGTRTLGDGAFGNVNICRRRDDHSVVVVAIKRMRYSEDETRNAQMDRALEKEITLLRLCKHPNILEYWGLSGAPGRQGGDVGIVTTYMQNGTLVKYLSNNPGADRHKLLREVALGLEYLHTPRRDPSSGKMITIVHGDIHSKNVLVTATGTAVLADFGLSKIAQAGALASLSLRPDGVAAGLAKYLAPEVHDLQMIQAGWPAAIRPEVAQQHADYAGRRTAKADIFAFGMLVFDTFGGDASRALGPGKSATATIVALIEGKRPARGDVAHPAFRDADWQLVRACWQGNAAGRPSIGDVRVRL